MLNLTNGPIASTRRMDRPQRRAPLDRYFIQRGKEDTELILFGMKSVILLPQFAFT